MKLCKFIEINLKLIQKVKNAFPDFLRNESMHSASTGYKLEMVVADQEAKEKSATGSNIIALSTQFANKPQLLIKSKYKYAVYTTSHIYECIEYIYEKSTNSIFHNYAHFGEVGLPH